MKKKLKSLYNKNKVLFVLVTIMIVCFIIIIIGLLTSFYKKVNTSKYGDRLDGIKEVEISKSDVNEYKRYFEEADGVLQADLNIKGKIIYVNITFDEGTKVSKAKKVATEGLNEFEPKEVKYYDIQYILSCDDNKKDYPTMGYKNNTSDSIVWTNRN